MPPALKHFSLHAMETVFVGFGIHLLEKFSDGQTRWGDQSMTKPYKGISCMAQRSEDFTSDTKDFYDISTISGIVYRLGKSDVREKIFAELEKHLFETD
jgi:hypothetical protein